MRLILQKTKRADFRCGFSLIEVVVVVAVVALLVGVAVPIFGVSSGNSKQASREIIKAHLQQARGRAISSGRAIAVVIPAISSNSEISGGALNLVEVSNENGSYVPAKEDPNDPASAARPVLQGWEKLPGNLRFVPQSLTSSSQVTIADQTNTISVKYRNNDVPCNSIVFSANGQIVFPTEGLCIAIAQAVGRGGEFRITEMNELGPVFDLLEVNRLTGRTRFIEPR